MGSIRDLSKLDPSTVAVTAGRPDANGEPLNSPIVAASTFLLDPLADGQREYSRNEGTSQWEALEDAIGALEGGPAVAYSSGMAGVSALLDLLGAQARLVLPGDCYQGVEAIVAEREQSMGWKAVRLAPTDTESWLDAIAENPDLVWLESPSNPLLQVTDLEVLCAAASANKVATVVDNTFATPLLQRPFDFGATVSLHSATKFIGGHSDLLGGIVVCNPDSNTEAFGTDLRTRLLKRRSLGGATMGAFEAFLALRGLRTLPVRLERAQASATELANRLVRDHRVTRVYYPGLPDSPGADVAARIMRGPGSMISFETIGGAESLNRALVGLEIIRNATSLGAVESTIERRNRLAGQQNIPPTLLRFSVGCEHPEDLWADLDALLGRVEAD